MIGGMNIPLKKGCKKVPWATDRLFLSFGQGVLKHNADAPYSWTIPAGGQTVPYFKDKAENIFSASSRPIPGTFCKSSREAFRT